MPWLYNGVKASSNLTSAVLNEDHACCYWAHLNKPLTGWLTHSRICRVELITLHQTVVWSWAPEPRLLSLWRFVSMWVSLWVVWFLPISRKHARKWTMLNCPWVRVYSCLMLRAPGMQIHCDPDQDKEVDIELVWFTVYGFWIGRGNEKWRDFHTGEKYPPAFVWKP